MTPDQERFRLLIALTDRAVLQGDRDAVRLIRKEMIRVGARLPDQEVEDLIGRNWGWELGDRFVDLIHVESAFEKFTGSPRVESDEQIRERRRRWPQLRRDEPN
jgi:hypothetical protein